MGEKLKITFISKSDLRGGAAIVTYRLVEALRGMGIDARMLVTEKLSDSTFVQLAASPLQIKAAFLAERLQVFLANGLQRSTLFKADPATFGLSLRHHPWVKDADAIFLGWVNQGMLSLDGIKKLGETGKPLVWIMHDMWNMTGICHHAGTCRGYLSECGSCPLLGDKKTPDDMSHQTWKRKLDLYKDADIRFVAVSSWLARKAEESSLMRDVRIDVIPNVFTTKNMPQPSHIAEGEKIRIIFGAARLDDPIKGLPVLKEALKFILENHPSIAGKLELVTFGSVKDPHALAGFAIAHRHLGTLHGEDAIREAYRDCRIVVSSSDFETLPGTLVEGQAYGCIPVAFDHGGQRDIIDHAATGWLAPWSDDIATRARSLADGIIWAATHANDIQLLSDMKLSVESKFSPKSVTEKILSLLNCQTSR